MVYTKSQFARLLLLCCLPVSACFGQSWNEFFKQKKTQKKYLLTQIAALQVYTGYLKKGYEITSSGLSVVKNFTSGEFDLHKAFFASLEVVAPEIKDGVKVAETIRMSRNLLSNLTLITNDQDDASHRSYFLEIKQLISSACAADLEELLLVITSGRIKMTAEERISRIDQIYLRMQEKYAFTQSFISQANILKSGKQQQRQTIYQLKKLWNQ